MAVQNSPVTPDESLRNTMIVSPMPGLEVKFVSCSRAMFAGARSISARDGVAHTTDDPSTPRKVMDMRSNATISPAADDTPRNSADMRLMTVLSSRRTFICCVVRWKNRCCPTITAVTMVPNSPRMVMVTSSSTSVNPRRRGRRAGIIDMVRWWCRSWASTGAGS